DEEEAAQFIRRHVSKPVVAFVAGQTAPPGKRMGHAGAIVSGGTGTAAEKIAAFEAAGVPVAQIPSEIPALIAEVLARRRVRSRRSDGTAPRSVTPRANGTRKVAKKPARQVTSARTNGARRTSKPTARAGKPLVGKRAGAASRSRTARTR